MNFQLLCVIFKFFHASPIEEKYMPAGTFLRNFNSQENLLEKIVLPYLNLI